MTIYDHKNHFVFASAQRGLEFDRLRNHVFIQAILRDMESNTRRWVPE